MTAGEGIERVLVYEDSSRYADIVVAGAELADWEACVFKNPHDAIGNFQDGAGALVTTLGIRDRTINWRFPGQILTDFSDRHNIPRAVFSGHPHAFEFIRRGTSDIVVPKRGGKVTPQVFSRWLLGLAEFETGKGLL